jgi:uncharacterized protein DUF2795
MDFPANKQRLLDTAERNGCDDGTVNALRGIPSATYTNVAQVAASLTLAGKWGIADGDKATVQRSPITPIFGELDENRRC